MAVWFVGAALLHDLVLLPLYALADRSVVRGLGAAGHRVGHRPRLQGSGGGRCTSVSRQRCPACSCSCGSR
ncbi:hypothetical protein WKI71_43560 [Streptomyces sp. MS1.AVA.1]|uniref:Uncharacterized protein n=1 Tax=Streptomyces machairae TaxID=3134109 RepID=A0ABU8UV01_9ACTN